MDGVPILQIDLVDLAATYDIDHSEVVSDLDVDVVDVFVLR